MSSRAGPASAEATPGTAVATAASEADAIATSARYSAIASFFLLAECSCQSSGEIVGGRVDPFLVLTPPRPLKVSRPIPRVSMPVGSLVFVGRGPASAVTSPTGGAGSVEGVEWSGMPNSSSLESMAGASDVTGGGANCASDRNCFCRHIAMGKMNLPEWLDTISLILCTLCRIAMEAKRCYVSDIVVAAP